MLYHLLHIPFSPSLKPHALSLTPQALSHKPYPLNKIKHALLLLVFLLVGVTSAMAQLHPIQLNLICPPTLPGSVNGLYQANGLKATLTLLDKYQPSLEVGVGFTMRGNGVTIEKRPDYLGETPTLLFAMPKVLGEDFFSSLLQEGVSYNGPNRDAFESKGTLTSGRYELTLWAYDLNRPAVRISNLARVYLWIQKSNPPILTFPLDKAIVYAIPQQFSWSVAPNSNGLTTPRYKFQLYELNDPNRDPADEVMSSEPFFEEEVAAPTFSYLTYHPQLIRGKGYAWRIQAIAYDQNQQEIPLFNNNGFSAIRSFSYGQDATSTLKQLLAIEAKSKNPYSMDVKVVADPSGKMDTPDGFKLEYRKAGAEEWSQVEVDDDYTTLAKLTPNTEYELRGYPRMGALYGDAGPMVKARTQSPPEVKCGTKSSYKPDASTKLASLATGDIVTANQIPFTITEVKNSDGSFTGMAFAGVPFFGGKKLAYKLNNATFNSKYELTGGSIVADTIGIERYINKKVAEQAAKEATANEKKGDILADEKTVKVGGDIKDVTSIKVDTSDKEHPKAIVTTVDGKEQVVDIPKNGTITLADSTGEVYTASSDGTVNNIGMYAGAASGTGTMAGSVQQKPKKLYGADLLVEFLPDPQQLYGFDNPFSLGENFWKEKYDTTQVAGRTFFVPAKMVAAGATDKVVATLKGEAADHPENLSFTTTTGMRYMASPGLAKGTLQLTLAGGAPDSRQELTAWMKQGDSTVAVGRLSIDAFQSISRRVVVVPVGDATYDQAAALAEGLNGIYKQAGVRWDATVADQVLPMPEGVGESIKVDKSLFSAYSAGMRRIRSAFCSTSTYQRLGDQDIYYIFLTTLPMNGEDENAPFDGYMPYGKPFGFVRSAGMGATELAWTIAHELGHGAFQLQHVWKEQGYTTDTRNLMGYSKTGELFRWQWQDIHHPVSHSNLLADEEDLGVKNKTPDYFGQIVIRPDGKKQGIHSDAIAILNEKAQTIAFFTPDESFFYWVNGKGYFIDGVFDNKKSYDFYVEDKYNRKAQPISWGIYLAAHDIGKFTIDLIESPVGTTSGLAKGLWQIATLQFDIEKTWERIVNADLTDASYVAASISLAYLSGPKALKKVPSTELSEFREVLEDELISKVAQRTWSKQLAIFAKAKVFERSVSNYLRTMFTVEEGYTVIRQVYLKVDGVMSIADDIIYNNKTKLYYLNESKYGVKNTLRKNQKVIDDAIRAGKEIEIRSKSGIIDNTGAMVNVQGDKITIAKVLRSHSTDGNITGSTVKTIWEK